MSIAIYVEPEEVLDELSAEEIANYIKFSPEQFQTEVLESISTLSVTADTVIMDMFKALDYYGMKEFTNTFIKYLTSLDASYAEIAKSRINELLEKQHD